MTSRAERQSVVIGMLLAACCAGSVHAQRPQRPRANALRDQIETTVMNQMTRDMGLTADQAPKFQRIVTNWGQKRRALDESERAMRMALSDQMRPGIQANSDSVSRLVDGILANRVTYQQSFQDEMRELSPVLNPVQRGIYLSSVDRLMQRVRDLQQQRIGAARRGGTVPRLE